MWRLHEKASKEGRVCPHQAAFLLDNWIRRLFQNPVKLLEEYVREGDTVIDLGCGPGFFTIDMAKMVGSTGNVIAIDLQPAMLERVRKKALRAGVADRLLCHQCRADRLGLSCEADFILAYYMVHETPDPASLFAEVKGLLRPGGRMLVVEPKMHVAPAAFDTMLEKAAAVGMKVEATPSGKGGRAALLMVT
jgi:ubiquinone/menaquinone biosynthesis C-methylase UbiE